ALHGWVALDDALIVWVGGETVLHPVPLPLRDHHGPRQRGCVGYWGQPAGPWRGRCALHAEDNHLAACLHLPWAPGTRQCHRSCLSGWGCRQRLAHGLHLVPAQDLRVDLRLRVPLHPWVLGCGPGEEPPAFLWRRSLLDELEAHATGCPAPR